jgi:hypothetical protein
MTTKNYIDKIPTISEKLNIILKGVENKPHVEEFSHPRHVSLVIFGQNLFPFNDNLYVDMAELIKG